jgi:hypothetical protein
MQEKNITPQEEEQTFTVQEAADFIGISRRSFESLKLSAVEEYRKAKDGKERKVNVYKLNQIEPIKKRRETPVVKPSLATQTTANEITQVVTLSDLLEFAKVLTTNYQQENQKLLPSTESEQAKKHVVDISSFEKKQILNFNQALHYSGLPKDELKSALDEKKIKAKRKTEKSPWQIYKNSLDAFIKDYFS